jgi:hypothetical protein
MQHEKRLKTGNGRECIAAASFKGLILIDGVNE